MFPELVEKLIRREDLTVDKRRRRCRRSWPAGRPTPHRRGFLIGLAMKGERPHGSSVSRERCASMPCVWRSCTAPVFDTCGTGGDRTGILISRPAPPSCWRVACASPNTNRSVSSLCGSADVFEVLALVTAPPAVWSSAVSNRPTSALRTDISIHRCHAAAARRASAAHGVPICSGRSPTGRLPRQIVGVPSRVHRTAGARAVAPGSERAWVVHGADGLDEISTTGYTKNRRSRGCRHLLPAPGGWALPWRRALRGGSASDNARIIVDVLDGRTGPARDVVVLNAGAALFVAGQAASVGTAWHEASAAIDRWTRRRPWHRWPTRANRKPEVPRERPDICHGRPARHDHPRQRDASLRCVPPQSRWSALAKRADAVTPRPGVFTAALSRNDRYNVIAE